MQRNVIYTDQAPQAVGPYSQAIQTESFVFTAGQIAIDPETGQLISADVQTQARQALQNLQTVLEAAGAGMDTVVKTTVFLKHMGDFALVNEVYAEFFSTDPPARSAIQAAALPLGALVEVEAIALRRI